MSQQIKYLPFLTGIYSVAPGLMSLHKAQDQWDRNVFQADEEYNRYLQNKRECREENISKYYLEHNLPLPTVKHINQYIAKQLQQEYPDRFIVSLTDNEYQLINKQTEEIVAWHADTMQINSNNYLSPFDALCSQVQEDVAICQLQNGKDWLAAIHLCSPNHWSPEEKIGMSFNAVHAPVADMQKTFLHSFKMMQLVVEKGPFTRFAWGIATDTRLNHHPAPPAETEETDWQGRKTESSTPLYIRTERQNLIGFPDINAFLFTIRTYFYPVNELNKTEMKALFSAVKSMSPEALTYKGMNGILEILEEYLPE